MPSSSAKQAKFMRAIAHSPAFAKKVGVKQSVGKDFEMADKKAKKFAGGGSRPAPGTNDPDYEDEGVMKPKPKPKMKPKPSLGNNDPYEPIPPKMKPEPRKPLGPMGKKGYATGGAVKRIPTPAQMGDLNMAKGGGVEKKGKTKTKMVKMAKGGSIDGIAQRGKTRCAGAHKGIR